MKAPIASLVALKIDGNVDDSVPPLPVYEGLNTFGRNNCSLFNKQISREHLRLDAWPECRRFDVYVVGPNPIVVRSEGKNEKLGPQEWTSIQLSDIIYFLPNEFPFRIDNIPPELVMETACDVTTPVRTNRDDAVVCASSSDEAGLTRKRHAQLLEDEALARKLQDEENKSLGEYLPPRSSDMRAYEVSDCPQSKLRKTEIASRSSASTFRLLRTMGLPRSANNGCVRIEDVIEGDVQFVLLSNYMVDPTWLLPACPILSKVPVVLIHGESGNSLELLHVRPSNWFLHKPPLPLSYGTHHSKAMLLVYRTGVRVVVHTANLVSGDWNYKTQGLWMQDFPYKEACKQRGLRTDPRELKMESEFEKELVDYLRHLNWNGCTVNLPELGETRVDAGFFKMFDYRTAAVRLVASVPGYHSGPNLTKYGHMKMRSILAQMKFENEFEDSPFVFQFSSLGSLDEKWIAELTTSMSAGRTLGEKPLGGGKVQFVWPTVEDIRLSLEGYAAGGSVPSPQKNIKPFLSKYWAKWSAGHFCRGRAMPHIKTYLRYHGQSLAWFLLTSSNMSKAAWGALQKNSTQLMIRSYELGVLFLPSSVLKASSEAFSCTGNSHGSELQRRGLSTLKNEDSEEGRESQAKLVTTLWQDGSLTTSKSIVGLPVPYTLPPPGYETGDVPWSWDRQYTDPDVYGDVWP